MRKCNKFALALAAAMCLGLAACSEPKKPASDSASGQVTSSAAASEVEANTLAAVKDNSETLPEEGEQAVSDDLNGTEQEDDGVIRSIGDFQITDPMADGSYAAAIVSGTFTDDGCGEIGVELYNYDKFDEDDIEQLKQGDILYLNYDANSGLEPDYTGTQVESIELYDGGATINDEFVGDDGTTYYCEGKYLKKEDGIYCYCGSDGTPLYYYVGETTLLVADDVVISDGSADPDSAPSVYTGYDILIEMMNSDWKQYNTTIKIEDGKVVEVDVIWVP